MGFYLDLQIQLQILLSSGDAKGAESVARAATQRHSQSVPVWSLCLETLMQLESGDVGQLFQAAHRQIHPKVHRPQDVILLVWSSSLFTLTTALHSPM